MKRNHRHHRQRGMTLLEMLIALLVLSLGMLGIAALQARGQQYNTAAHVRTQATILAAELIERIRVNPDPNGDGVLDDYAVNPPFFGVGSANAPLASSIPDPAKDCNTETCTPQELVGFDLKSWAVRVDEAFPGGRVNIVYNTTGSNTNRNYTDDPPENLNRYQIDLTWQLSDQEAGQANIKTMTWVVTP